MSEGYLRQVKHDLKEDLSLWFVDLEAYAHAVCLEGMLPSELAKAERLSSQNAAKRFLASRHALRILAAEALQCEPAGLNYSHNEFGKPGLTGCDLQFNLSRSGPMALIGLSWNLAVGVDLEAVCGVQEMEALAQRNYTVKEYASWHSKGADQLSREFLVIWTLKEACLKALGTGVSVPPVSVETDFSPGARLASVRLGNSRCNLIASSIQLPGDFVGAAALASARAVSMARQLVGRPAGTFESPL